MKYTTILIVLLFAFNNLNAQTVKAITQHGQTVVLYENGTWKYEKDVQTTSTEQATVVAPLAGPVTTKVDIATDKNATSEKVEVCNAISKKLSRFFGEEKGRVRCSASAINQQGEISLNFEFMMQIGDANRYFGYSANERPITLELSDGTRVTTVLKEEKDAQFIDKWNVSYYVASIKLSQEDVVKLVKNNTLRLFIDWKKLEEEYQVDNMDAIKNALLEVI